MVVDTLQMHTYAIQLVSRTVVHTETSVYKIYDGKLLFLCSLFVSLLHIHTHSALIHLPFTLFLSLCLRHRLPPRPWMRSTQGCLCFQFFDAITVLAAIFLFILGISHTSPQVFHAREWTGYGEFGRMNGKLREEEKERNRDSKRRGRARKRGRNRDIVMWMTNERDIDINHVLRVKRAAFNGHMLKCHLFYPYWITRTSQPLMAMTFILYNFNVFYSKFPPYKVNRFHYSGFSAFVYI